MSVGRSWSLHWKQKLRQKVSEYVHMYVYEDKSNNGVGIMGKKWMNTCIFTNFVLFRLNIFFLKPESMFFKFFLLNIYYSFNKWFNSFHKNGGKNEKIKGKMTLRLEKRIFHPFKNQFGV